MYKVISLFSGCGGADLGLQGGFSFLGKRYSRQQVEFVHASDVDEMAVQTYNHNFDHKAVVADIKKLNFRKGSADIVIGGFPCQQFSTVNPTKNPNRKENQLFWEMARVIDQVRPKVFIAENVKGFYTLAGGKYFNLAKKEFESLGYRVYHKLINCADYGVPQLRQRIIIVGVRKDIKSDFIFPKPLHGAESSPKNAWVPLKKVIKSLIPEDERFYFSERAVLGAKNAKPNMKRAVAQDLEKPCLTITSHLAKVSINSRDPVLLVDPKKEKYRRFTPREAASIQSFPETFEFPVSDTRAYKQIGNAIPPAMFWHIGKALIALLDANKAGKVIEDKSARQLEMAV